MLYTGGMFLNDAFDAEFDRQHRPERPIPSGKIDRKVVWVGGSACLVLGLVLIYSLGLKATTFAAVLVVCIVIYDAIHKRTTLAPLLMSACRFLLYLVAASVAQHGTNETVWWRALVLAAYIIGLSYLARGESTGGVAARWPLLLLLAPIALTVATGAMAGTVTWIVSAGFVLWIVWCIRAGLFRTNRNLSSSVAGLLAGIVLVDWLAAVSAGQAMGLAFIGLFLLALILQRFAPAT